MSRVRVSVTKEMQQDEPFVGCLWNVATATVATTIKFICLCSENVCATMNNSGFLGVPLSCSPPFSHLPQFLVFLLIFSGGWVGKVMWW